MKCKRFLFYLPVALFLLAYSSEVFAQLSVKFKDISGTVQADPCGEITFEAEVTIDSGTVNYVTFWVDGVRKRKDGAAPYNYTWKNLNTGFYAVVARVLDDAGNEAFSDTLTVVVGNPVPGNILQNPSFNCSLSPWYLQLFQEGSATAQQFNDGYFNDSTYAHVYIDNPGLFNWSVQLTQSIDVDSGNTYSVTFLADTPESKEITVLFQQAIAPYSEVYKEPVVIDGYGEYGPIEFVSQYTGNVGFKFVVGGNTTEIFLDEVVLIETAADTTPEYRPTTEDAISMADHAPVVDGMLDAVWKNAGADRDYQLSSPAKVDSLLDAALEWRGLWTTDSLYLFVSVIDDTLVHDRLDAALWKDDGIELWLDGDNSNNPAGGQDGGGYNGDSLAVPNDFHILFPIDTGLPGLFDAPIFSIGATLNPEDFNFAARRTEVGVDVEIAISMSALSIDPNADALFGIEIEYNDDDDGDTQDTKVKTFNSGASLWNDPSEMGTVRLDSRVAYDFLDVSMADAPFAIDGMEDAAWANYPLISSNQWVDGPLGAELGWQDNSFDFRAAWYSDNLYVIVYASHDTLIEDRPAGQEVQYWNDTSIEFWLDFDNSKSVESKDDNDVNFGFSWDAASGVDETIGGNMADTVKTAMQRAAMVTKYGVIYELAIPLALAPTPLALQEGTVFGFDIGNIDDDAGSSTKATYWATTNTIWKDPSLWGTAKLMGPLVSGVDEKIAVELNYELSQNYPNPFNPTTNIAYSIPKDSHVKLTIFNTLGQRVATLVDSRVQAGKHIVRFDAHRLPSGIYFYRLQAGKTVMNKKLMLLK